MAVQVIDIGTSKGIKIPANILKLLNSPKSFNMLLEDNKIVLEIKRDVRKGWDRYFKVEDKLLIDDGLDLQHFENEI